ncbi:hypothetical protein U3A58_19700 [Algoriphagus sp. C2-6-M1]|uniref:hypothetical protein n=1 Tax=Algoriphagus persicinus TaxID=3108754 RepID=UPI002B39519C|nr:hypothetical protein [Algoriphagus sp. C2-6-M1]MEB2782623.1 hypothetical protein [Algoriphagus sp. C2-6-M1]
MKAVTNFSFSSSILVIPEIMISKQSYVNGISMLFIGILGLSLGFVFAITTYSLTFLYQGIELISYFLIFYALFSLIKIRVNHSYFSLMVSIYLLWQILILARGDFTDLTYFDLKQLLFDLNYGGFVLFIPVIAFLPLKLIVFKKLFEVIAIMGIIFLCLAFFNLPVLLNPDLMDLDSLGMVETYAKYLVVPVGILAINFDLLEKRYKILVVITLLSILFFSIFRARRGLILIQLSIIALSLIIHFYKSNRKLSILTFFAYALLSFGTYFSSNTVLFELSFLENISERGFENTRKYVENCFFNDMNLIDWVVGKGFNAGYHCPGIDDSVFKDSIRTVIETDYLQLIMMGGIVNVVLLLLCIFPALYLGLFKSNSIVAKSLVLWICIWLISLYPANVYSLNLYHISIWICVGFCYSKSFRELSQEEIRVYFLKEINPNKFLSKSGKS